jgi:hypothetical protein
MQKVLCCEQEQNCILTILQAVRDSLPVLAALVLPKFRLHFPVRQHEYPDENFVDLSGVQMMRKMHTAVLGVPTESHVWGRWAVWYIAFLKIASIQVQHV